ncbi:MAG: GAF domain-containing protein [Anaerolineae bacterium]|nr:GAF domain-containing protein [Anaerolineae bacterium]
MTSRPGAHERIPPPNLARFALAVVPALAALALGALLAHYTRSPANDAAGIIFAILLYVALGLLEFRPRTGVYSGLLNVVPVAAFFAMGAWATLIVLAAGAALVEVGRLLLWKPLRQQRRSASEAVLAVIWNVGVKGLCVFVVGLPYVALDEPLPFTAIRFDRFGMYVVLALAFALLYTALVMLTLRVFEGRSLDRRHVAALPRFFLIDAVSFLLGMLVASSYFDEQFGTVLSLTGGILISGALLRRLDRSELETEQRLEELAILNRISSALSSSLALPELLQSVYDQVSSLMHIPIFSIAIYDPESQHIDFPFFIQNGVPQPHPSRPMANGVTDYILRTGKPVLISGLTVDAVDRQLARMGIERLGLGALCYAGVPLIADQEVLGVLAVQSIDNPQAFGQAELSLLSTVAAQAAGALRNANLYNRVYELADKLALLNNVSSVVTASIDLDKVLNTVCAIVIEVGYADKTGIFLADESGKHLSLAYAIGLSDDYIAQFQEIVHQDDGSGPIQILSQTEPVAISDVHADPRGRGWRSLAEVEGYTGLLAVPLVASEQVIGFLAMFYQQAHQFSKTELDLMNTLANQVAVAVANARLHEDTRARAYELSRLVDASRAFTSTLDLSDVAEKVFDELSDLLHPDSLTLRLLEPDGALVLLAQRGLNTPSRQTPPPSVELALQSGKSIMLPQDSADVDALHDQGLQSLLVIPLVSQEKAFGALSLGYRKARAVTGRQRQLVEAMVNQAATAIRNAQLFSQTDAELDNRVAELSSIEAISRKISGSLDLDAIIADVLETALQVTRADLCGFALVTEDPESLSLVERYRQGDLLPPIVQSVRRNEGVIGRVLRSGEIANIGDTDADPDYYPSSLPHMRSELCVPIINNGERVGALNVESSRRDGFTKSDERFLVNLAEHAAIALGNARLFNERQQQIETLIKLRNLSLELLSSSTLQEVMNLIVEYTLIIAQAKDVHLYLYDAATDTLTFGASLWLDGRQNVEASRPSRDGRTYQVVHSRRMLLIPVMRDIQAPGEFRTVGYGAIARIPLRRGDQVFGVLIITWRDAHYYTDNETRIFDLVASQAAIAIENARLFEEVRAGRDRMQLIMDSARDGMVLIDQKGTLALANRAAEHLLGYPLHHFTGQNVLRLIVRVRRELTGIPNLEFWIAQVRQMLAEVRASPTRLTRRAYQVQSGGTTRDVEEITLPVQGNEGETGGRLLVLRDVSQEMALKRFQDDMTDTLVHDLRSPALGIKGNLNFIRDLIEMEMYADLGTSIAAALDHVEMQLRLVDSLLDIRKLEAGQMLLHQNAVSLHAMVEKSIAARLSAANNEHIRVINRVPVDFPLVSIDEYLVSRVVSNLLDNAIRHTPSQGEVRIEVATEQVNGSLAQGYQARMAVVDTGNGVPVDMRERIFEKFVQVQGSALRGRRGTGIGLSFCKLAVEAHGGKIWVENGPEGGAAFVFTLPLAT